VTVDEPKDDRPALRKRHRLALFTTKLGRAGVWLAQVVSQSAQTGAIAIWQAVRAAAKFVWKALSFVVEAVYTLLYLLGTGIIDVQKFIRRGAGRMARRTTKVVCSAWSWILPRLRRVDIWLELQMRRIENRTKNELSRHETVRSVAAISREYRKSVNELHPRKVVQSARRQAAAIKTIKSIKTKSN
jgi:hypothetical protein